MGRAKEKDLGLFGTSSEQQPARGQKMEVAEWLDDQSPYLFCNVHSLFYSPNACEPALCETALYETACIKCPLFGCA